MFTPHRKRTYGPSRPVTGIALLFYMWMIFVPHRKHAYGPLQPVTGGNFTFLYVDDVRTSQEMYLWASTACYGDSFTFIMEVCRIFLCFPVPDVLELLRLSRTEQHV
jgi:hypothetical protein